MCHKAIFIIPISIASNSSMRKKNYLKSDNEIFFLANIQSLFCKFSHTILLYIYFSVLKENKKNVVYLFKTNIKTFSSIRSYKSYFLFLFQKFQFRQYSINIKIMFLNSCSFNKNLAKSIFNPINSNWIHTHICTHIYICREKETERLFHIW